jgi:hypothetical protein
VKNPQNSAGGPASEARRSNLALAVLGLIAAPVFAQGPLFTPGNIVVAVEGCGLHGSTCTSVPHGTGSGAGSSSAGGYGDNQGAPLTLFQYAPNATSSVTFVNSLALPQIGSGANLPVSSEYGSSSEGTLQLSGGGQFLTIMGYGINAATFDAAYAPGFLADPYGAAPSGALAQSGSLTGQTYTPIPRVVALIDANGNVNSSTALLNIFDTNNPRSVYTLDGVNAWVSGQGSGSDATGGVFYVPLFKTDAAPVAITGLDTTGKTIAQDTRDVQVYNNTLYVSVDSKEGSGSNRDFIGTLGTPPSTTLFNNKSGPTQLSGFATSGAGKLNITAAPNSNGNNLNAGMSINLSPVSYFFAAPNILYVADGGNPKNDSNGDTNSTGKANIGNGGLQKWKNAKTDGSGSWSLLYTLYQGLNLVNNGSATGTSGLYGLAGVVNGDSVQLYATNFTLNDLDATFLYGITDTLSNTTPPGASLVFSLLDTAPADSNFKGVAFAPTIPNGSVQITSSPSGMAFTVSGTGCGAAGPFTAPQTLAWIPGSSCSLSVVTPQTYYGTQYTFKKWEDGTTGTTHTVTAPATTATYMAAFFTTPTISWPAPAAIAFGSALSSSQLDAVATAPGVPSLAGVFTYNPPAGAVLPVGNNEPLTVSFTPSDTTDYTPASGNTTITINPPAASGPVSLVVTRTMTRNGGNVVVQLTIANTGGTSASNVVLSSVKVGADTATPLPQSLGAIAPGSSVRATVTVPASVGASGAASSLTVSGTYAGGTFSSSARITLP